MPLLDRGGAVVGQWYDRDRAMVRHRKAVVRAVVGP